jgi:hypothetical protein
MQLGALMTGTWDAEQLMMRATTILSAVRVRVSSGEWDGVQDIEYKKVWAEMDPVTLESRHTSSCGHTLDGGFCWRTPVNGIVRTGGWSDGHHKHMALHTVMDGFVMYTT